MEIMLLKNSEKLPCKYIKSHILICGIFGNPQLPKRPQNRYGKMNS